MQYIYRLSGSFSNAFNHEGPQNSIKTEVIEKPFFCKTNIFNDDMAFNILGYLSPLDRKIARRISKNFHTTSDWFLKDSIANEKCDFFTLKLSERRPIWLHKKFITSDGYLSNSEECIVACIRKISERFLNICLSSQPVEQRLEKERAERVIFFFTHPKFVHETIDQELEECLEILPGESIINQELFAIKARQDFFLQSAIIKIDRCSSGWLTDENVIVGQYPDGKHILQQGRLTSASTTCAAMLLLDHKKPCKLHSLIQTDHETVEGRPAEVCILLGLQGLKVDSFTSTQINIEHLKKLNQEHGSIYIYKVGRHHNFIIDTISDASITIRFPQNGYRVEVCLKEFLEKVNGSIEGLVVVNEQIMLENPSPRLMIVENYF